MKAFRRTYVEQLGEYRLTRLLATGGMAQVYEGHRLGPHGFDKRIAIKRILPELAEDERLATMFCDEARLQATLAHPNLVQVVDFGDDQGELFIAMEFVDGFHCGELVERARARRGRVDLAPALYIAREMLRGLAYVHGARGPLGNPRGLVHGDLSPHNVLLGSAGQVKIADFGIARAGGSLRTGGSLGAGHEAGATGKLGYLSPEQALGTSVDHRSDLYSVGVILAELLLGQALFTGQSEYELLRAVTSGDLSNLRVYGWNLPGDVRNVLAHALAVDATERYQCADDFRADLEELVQIYDAPLDRYELVDYLAELGLIRLQSGLRRMDFLDAFTTRSPAPQSVTEAVTVRPGVTAGAASYRVRTGSGSVFGPLSMPALLEMAATGRLPDDSQISHDWKPFGPPSRIEGLCGLWSRHPYRFFETPAADAKRQPVRVQATPAQLFQLSLSGATGLLQLVSEDGTVRVYFEEGVPVFSSATDPSTLLGARLVERGVVSREAIENLLADGFSSDRPLGALLRRQGLIDEAKLEAELESQLEARLALIAGARRGELTFVSHARCQMTRIPTKRKGPAWARRAIVEGFSEEEMERLLTPVWHRELELTADASDRADRLQLGAADRRVLTLVGRGRTVASLLHEVRSDRALYRVRLRSVFVGLVANLIAPLE